MTVQAATSIVYTVTGGKSLKKFFDLLVPSMTNVRQTYYILFFTCAQFFISQTPNFNSLKSVSLLAAIMSFGYVYSYHFFQKFKLMEVNHYCICTFLTFFFKLINVSPAIFWTHFVSMHVFFLGCQVSNA